MGTRRTARADTNALVESIACLALGTLVSGSAPLISVGLDSLAAIDIVQRLSEESGLEISPTALFDHPTLDSLARCLHIDFREE